MATLAQLVVDRRNVKSLGKLLANIHRICRCIEHPIERRSDDWSSTREGGYSPRWDSLFSVFKLLANWHWPIASSWAGVALVKQKRHYHFTTINLQFESKLSISRNAILCTRMFPKKNVYLQGLAPRVVNNALYSCLVMLGYETVKKYCVLPQYKDSVIW